MWNRLQGLMSELLPGWARNRALRRRRASPRPPIKGEVVPPPADRPPVDRNAPPTGGGNA